MIYTTTDTELTSVADAIRSKTGKTSSISFPNGFVSEIGSISGGGGSETTKIYHNATGTHEDVINVATTIDLSSATLIINIRVDMIDDIDIDKEVVTAGAVEEEWFSGGFYIDFSAYSASYDYSAIFPDISVSELSANSYSITTPDSATVCPFYGSDSFSAIADMTILDVYVLN